jgi:xanthine dehydrogenase YagT iron-sulfur-binding subunit
MSSFDSSRRALLKRTGAAAGAAAAGSLLTDTSHAAGRASSRPGDERDDRGVAAVDVVLRVNGSEHHLVLDPRTTLLDALREHLQLTGSKKGCGLGQCGACTVLLDGKRVNACLWLAALVDGHAITTIEGVSRGEELHPLQAAFIARDAFQCGYCTSGQIMSGIACIAEGHAGSAAEIHEWMSGNICRCGAYQPIALAIQDAAKDQRHGNGD